MLGSANLSPSVYLVFTVILSKVVRLLQNLVHMVPQTSTNSPLLSIVFTFAIKTNMAQESALSVRTKRFVNRVRRRTLSVRQA